MRYFNAAGERISSLNYLLQSQHPMATSLMCLGCGVVERNVLHECHPLAWRDPFKHTPETLKNEALKLGLKPGAEVSRPRSLETILLTSWPFIENGSCWVMARITPRDPETNT